MDESGSFVNTCSYDAWGNITDQTETIDNPIKYAGEYLDNETGLYYLRNRYYDPTIGRFTQEDPIRDEMNWYIYCGDNPVRFTDSTGLNPELDEYIKNNYSGKVTVTFAVARPVTNSRQAIDSGFTEVGHTFIRLDFGDGRVYYRGFYPLPEGMTTEQILQQTDVTGRLDDDSSHQWQIAKTYAITGEQANNILSFIEGYRSNYNMVSNNCTTWAVNALKAGGQSTPTWEHQWTLPDGSKQLIVDNLPWKANLAWGGKDKIAQDLLGGLYGYTPADAAQDMKLGQGYYVVNYGGVQTRYYTPH